MRDEAIALARAEQDTGRRLNVLREYLQMYVLRSLHECEAFLSLSFVGGTALRFLYRLPRYSEDLDFSVDDVSAYAPARWLQKVGSDLKAAGFEASVQWRDQSVVHVAWLRFAGLMKQAGLSGLATQKLSIKLEIDTRPPAGAASVVTVLKRHEMMAVVRHYDQASLLAGKLRAVLTRKYTKGRDLYDLLWYLADREWPAPNLDLLNNALRQTGWSGEPLRADTWRRAVAERLAKVNWTRAQEDVAPFLERAGDVRLLAYKNFLPLLEAR